MSGLMPLALAILATSSASAQDLPTLEYTPPPDFYRSAITPPEAYSSNAVNAGLQVYAFRPFQGNLPQLFQQTLLRDWIDPQFQEQNVAAQPLFQSASAQGAELVLVARFIENIAGSPRPHMRVAILANNAVAVVDLSANSDYSMGRAWPAMQVVLNSMKVVAHPVPVVPPGVRPAAAVRAVAGLFIGTKPRYVVNLNRSVGNGDWVTATHFYLFAADGHMYRGYDLPQAPGGDTGASTTRAPSAPILTTREPGKCGATS